jgi:uncharacterized Zn-binding protein involved in type VI secretion
MSRPFIVLGDTTDHGGTVVGASVMSDTHGKGIARVGDQVTCPRPGHGTTVIVTGDPTMIIDGQPAARHGDKCACGATLISSQAVSTVGGGAASGVGATSATSSPPASKRSTAAPHAAVAAQMADEDLEYFFTAERDDGKAVVLAYRIDAEGEKLHEGILGHDGRTQPIPMSRQGQPTFWIPAT